MGLLDDAIREHLELKRQHGAAPDEVQRQEAEALSRVPRRGDPEPSDESAASPDAGLAAADIAVPGEESPILEPPPAIPAADQPVMPEPAGHEPVIEDFEAPEGPAAIPARRPAEAGELWLDDSDEEPPSDVLEAPASDAAAAQGAPVEEDVLEETPEFLQETPEHDRLWFEQRPPRGFDFEQ